MKKVGDNRKKLGLYKEYNKLKEERTELISVGVSVKVYLYSVISARK